MASNFGKICRLSLFSADKSNLDHIFPINDHSPTKLQTSYNNNYIILLMKDEVIMADGRRVPAGEGESTIGDENSYMGFGVGDAEFPAGPQLTGGYTPYARPSFFIARLMGLLILLVASIVLISLGFLVVPVALGRLMLGHMGLSQTPHHDALTLLVGVCSLMGWAKTVLW